MISVSTKSSETFTMADVIDVADLEDGEIGSDEEREILNKIQEKNEALRNLEADMPDVEPVRQPKSGKKKKSKKFNKGQKDYLKNKKHRKFPGPVEDDFAGNIEKAIRKALKNDEGDMEFPSQDDVDERRKHKKRKKYEGKDGTSKKRRKRDMPEDVDESEMICIRGASPLHKPSSPGENNYQSDDDRDSYASDSSLDSRNHQQRPQRHRPHREFKERKNKNDRDRRRGAHPMQDPDGVCLYFMQGKCHKGEDCSFSHDAQPPRKMELCKFYLMDCCAKRDKCLYMHSDFPCKFYHTGLPCVYKDDCKFAHGKPLNEGLKMILLKHIESAPKEILGDFPRLSRDGAAMMVANTQLKLMQQYSPSSIDSKDGIPSLFELSIPKPQGIQDQQHSACSPNNYSSDKQASKVSPKIRQSRWQNENSGMNYSGNAAQGNLLATPSILSIKNLTGVLAPKQIFDLTKMGIENLDQLSQLTVMQLNSLGLTLKQINEIQLNTISIQKLGLINSSAETQNAVPNYLNTLPGSKDLDMRIAPVGSIPISPIISSDSVGKDVDMRYLSSVAPINPNTDKSQENSFKPSLDPRINKDAIDIDQYTKDALKFASKEKENIDNMSNDHIDEIKNLKPDNLPVSKDIDHRVLQYVKDATSPKNDFVNPSKREADTDIRFLLPDISHKKIEKRHRRSTTDDEEDSHLLIDEKWYSSDEEKTHRKKSPYHSPIHLSPPSVPHVIEPNSVLTRLGDLSKIDISDEVTKLLTSMKNNVNEAKTHLTPEFSEISKPRDPRSFSKKSPEHKTPSVELLKISSQRRSSKVSIYECIEGEPTDGRRRTDVDLRQSTEFKVPVFGDTDLRQPATGGDIDFRLGLPFKPLPNYTPASEIDGSINCHPPINYKLVLIDIPRPDYTDIRNSTAKSQAVVDPRLRKVFRLSVDEPSSDSEKSVKQTIVPRADPRRKPSDNSEQKQSSLDLQNVIQNSNWYKELSSTQKILVNQQLATVTSLLKKHHQDKSAGKKFDLSLVQNPILSSIFTNLGISLDERGVFAYVSSPQEGLLKTPNYNQGSAPYGMGGNMSNVQSMEGNNMNMMGVSHMGMGNMGPMGNMNMGPMGGFNHSFPDPRSTPGLLGIAPNMPHNFDNSKYGGPQNYGPDVYSINMSFPGNDYGGMDGEQNYHRPNRGGYRGRGNDRWNRGGNNRGNRDRRNFGDHGGWKGERH